MSGVVAVRSAEKERFKAREGVDLTYVPFVIKATVEPAYEDVKEDALARQYVERKRMKPPTDEKETARIVRRLVRAGFSTGTIFKVLRSWKVDEEALVGARHDVAALDHDVRRRQPRRHVAAALAGDRADVVRLDLGLGLGVAATVDGDIVEALGALVENLRRSVLHRLEGVVDGGQLGVVDDDPGRTVSSGGLRGGGDGGDRLADVVDLLSGQGLVGTGDVGLAIYLWDCITGEPRFPTIDVF